MVLEEKEKNALLIDIDEKEEEKVMKYRYLAREVKRLWQLIRTVIVIPVVVWTLGLVAKNLELHLEKGGIEVSADQRVVKWLSRLTRNPKVFGLAASSFRLKHDSHSYTMRAAAQYSSLRTGLS